MLRSSYSFVVWLLRGDKIVLSLRHPVVVELPQRFGVSDLPAGKRHALCGSVLITNSSAAQPAGEL